MTDAIAPLEGKTAGELRTIYLKAIMESKFDVKMKGMAMMSLNIAPNDLIMQIAAMVDKARNEKDPSVFDKMLTESGLPQPIVDSIHGAIENLVK